MYLYKYTFTQGRKEPVVLDHWLKPELCPSYNYRWRWSHTCWMTRCAMNAREPAAVGNLLRFSVPMSHACSITVSFVGRTSTLAPGGNSISHWWRKEPTGHVRSTSAGTKHGLSTTHWEKGACGLLCLKILTCRRNKCILLLFTPVLYTCICISSQNTKSLLFFHQNPTSQAY